MLLPGLHGFITGAGTGIGRAIAKEMVREGADLYITDLDGEAAHRVAEEAQSLRTDAHILGNEPDARDAVKENARAEDVARRCDKVGRAWGREGALWAVC